MNVRSKPLWAFLIIWIIAFCLSVFIIDPDFGWHVQAGTYIRTGGIPAHDVFTYTASTFPWVDHEWLNDVVVSLLFQTGGITLVAALFASIWAGGMVLASRLYNLPTIVLAFASILDFVMARPSAWALLFFAVTERIVSQARRNWMLCVPFIFLIWANLHGSFIIGLVLILYYKLVIKSPIPWPIVIASFAATAFNPYGPRLYEEVFRTVFDTQLHSRINEWRSFSMPNYFLLSGTVLLGIFFAMNSKFRKKEFMLPLLLGIAALSSVRYYLMFIAGAMRYFEESVHKLQRVITEKFGKFSMLYFSAGISVCIVGIIFYNAITSPTIFPVKISEYLNEHACPGNVFNFYDYGGYLILHNHGQKVFIDGRMPSWKYNGTDYFQLYTEVLSSSERRQQSFQKYNVRCIVFSSSETAFISDLKQEDWNIILSEPGSVLLER